MPHGVIDEVLGKLQWSEDHWETTTSLEYFRGTGQRLPLNEEELAQRTPVDRLEMSIMTGEKRRKPDEKQREAWKKILARGDALWDEALDALITEYQRQRPLRVRYFQVAGDPALLDRFLPERVDRTTMREMVAPISCTLEWPEPTEGAVDFWVIFDVTWFGEMVNVYIHDGRVTEVTAMGSMHFRRRPALQSPVFGAIRREKNSLMPWCGTMEIEPFNTWAAVTVDRRHWDSDYPEPDERLGLPFRVNRTQVFVHGPQNKRPTPRQEAAFMAAQKATPQIIDALFAHFGQVADERRRTYKGPKPDLAVPRLKNPAELSEVTELASIHVFPDEGEKSIAVGFQFQGSWTGCAGILGNDGCGIRWRDGKVERVGDPRVADPRFWQRVEKQAT